jgi:DNA (cytosine-5)-methyltransferase 1
MMLDGQAYELPMPTLHTADSECSLLPTATTQDNSGKCRDHGGDLLHDLTCGCSRADRKAKLLPTPTAVEGTKGMTSTPEHRKATGHQIMLSNHAPQLTTSWGRFQPAIRRWEQTINRPAPAPTKPDGKDGNHRLSPEFTEWMMGLPQGWVTDCGLTRNEQLKACGNGVVPQQALLALQLLDVKP